MAVKVSREEGLGKRLGVLRLDSSGVPQEVAAGLFVPPIAEDTSIVWLQVKNHEYCFMTSPYNSVEYVVDSVRCRLSSLFYSKPTENVLRRMQRLRFSIFTI